MNSHNIKNVDQVVKMLIDNIEKRQYNSIDNAFKPLQKDIWKCTKEDRWECAVTSRER